MSTVAIAVEGVLRKNIGGSPIREGLDLYFGLATRAKVVLLTGEQHDALRAGQDQRRPAQADDGGVGHPAGLHQPAHSR